MAFASWPQNYTVRPASSTFLFGDVSGWTTNRCAVEQDTTVQQTGASTIKVTCTESGTLQAYKLNVPIPPTFRDGLVTFRVRQERENENASLILILSNSTANFTNSRYYGANQNAAKVGWNSLVFNLRDSAANLPFGMFYTNQGTGFDHSQPVGSIQFQVTNAVVGDVFYLDAVVDGRRSRPKVIFGFDSYSDALFSVGIPLFTARGIRGYFACSPLGDPAFYGTTQIANLRMAVNAGWDVINHGYSHTAMTALSDALVAFEVTENARLLTGHGVLNRPQYFMYPQNDCDERVQAILGGLGIVGGREIRNWRVCTDDYGLGVPRRTGAFALASKTLTQAKAALDDAILCGTTVNMYSHEIVAGGDGTAPPADPLYWYTNDMAALLDYALMRQRQGLIDIVTWHEWYTGLTQPTLVV